MSERESDRPIVVKKQGNACGAKGPAPMCRDLGKHSPDTEPGKGMEPKLNLLTKIAKEDGSCKFNNLMHLVNESSLRESFYLLKKDRAAGVDAVTFAEYEGNLGQNMAIFAHPSKN